MYQDCIHQLIISHCYWRSLGVHHRTLFYCCFKINEKRQGMHSIWAWDCHRSLTKLTCAIYINMLDNNIHGFTALYIPYLYIIYLCIQPPYTRALCSTAAMGVGWAVNVEWGMSDWLRADWIGWLFALFCPNALVKCALHALLGWLGNINYTDWLSIDCDWLTHWLSHASYGLSHALT